MDCAGISMLELSDLQLYVYGGTVSRQWKEKVYLCPPLSRGAVVHGSRNYIPSAVHVAEVASEDGGTSRQGLLERQRY